ncbi:MAG: c-type cytochrome [Myxococcota bacterium]|nr:c-type cytochrome [Myxococcota bacterium]
MRRRSALVPAAVALLGVLLCGPALAREASLRFEREGELVRELALATLRAACAEQTVEVAQDPYYLRAKRFRALALSCVLEQGFGAAPGPAESLFFRARDGYQKPASGRKLAQPGGWLAFADADRARGDDPGWEPIDRRQVDPAPFYVVWSGAGQNDPHRYPWPYQLEAIEIAAFSTHFPHTRPATAERGTAAWRGYTVFSSECIACHAINGEGGRVGPELNVPRSIVEYRPPEQIKAYVRDPSSFRYTTMPSHLHLSDEELDALVAYFEVMKKNKRDPGERPAGD